MKRDRFSSVGGPSASTLLSSLWSSVWCTSAMLRSSRPRSSTMPVPGSGVPRILTSARKEWPWISSLAEPSVVPGSACAASIQHEFVHSHISKTKVLSDTECLVCLQAESPLRMLQAIFHRARGIFDHIRAVHRLQRKTFEIEIDKILGRGLGLRVDELQFMPAPDQKLGAGFRAYANPVHAVRRNNRSVGLDADRKSACMQRIDQGDVHLQQRLAAGQHHIAVGILAGPLPGDGIG